MAKIFDFKGKGYLNIGLSALLLSILPLVQMVYSINPSTYGPSWTLYLTYFGAYFTIGFTYFTKKPLSSILAIVSTFCAMFTAFIWVDAVKSNMGMLSANASQINLVAATISAIAIGLCVVDFLFDISKLNIKNDYIMIAPFTMLALWSIFNLWTSYTAFGTIQLVMHILMLGWAIMGISITYLSAINKLDDFEFSGLTLDNIAFFIAGIAILLFIGAWVTVGTGLSIV